jgi:hypothetical protein
MPDLNEHGVANTAVEIVAALIDEIEERLERKYAAREAKIARLTYRKGYRAGRAAAGRGAPAVTNPELRARGDLRRLLNAA